MIKKVTKRDGRLVDYDFTKIIQSIKKAQSDIIENNEIGFNILNQLFFDKIRESINDEFEISDNVLSVEDIQEVIVNTLFKKPKYKSILDKYTSYKMKKLTKIIKRDGTTESFDLNKVFDAIQKSADRVNYSFTKKDLNKIKTIIFMEVDDKTEVTIDFMHGLVEKTLYYINKEVAESYTNYRNYKNQFGLSLLNSIEGQIHKILEDVDRSNSNSNSRLISTKRTDIAKGVSKELYQKIHLNIEEVQAMKDGYIYVHDASDLLLPQYNCILFDMKTVMSGGFEIENIFYTEPKDIRTAVGQMGDIILAASSQNFGGFTVPQVDILLAKYYKMSIDSYIEELTDIYEDAIEEKINNSNHKTRIIKRINEKAVKKAYRDMKQAIQGVEIKLNTVNSARGSFAFTTFSFGKCTNEYEADVSKAILEVRMEGHGKKGFKKSLIFPKLVFIHDEEIHGDKKEFEWLFDLSIKCSSKNMYPDYIGFNHIREGKVVSPMGCRAYLSNYRNPENGELVFHGRGNLGAISLHLPMIYAKAKLDKVDFYETLDYYLEMIRGMHRRRYEYVGKASASSNPLCWMEGGAYGGNLKANDNISDIIKSFTISFGITALNELSILHNGKSLRESNEFSKEVLEYINNYISRIKEDDNILYALYGTPAESLAGLQSKQFRNKFGVIKGVSDKDYVSNSFHIHVSEEVSPFEKQDLEEELFHLIAGGHIQYGRFGNPSNTNALKSFILRGLDKGFYVGVNFGKCTCEDCGNEFVGNKSGEEEICPNCGSKNITEVTRINGYMGYKTIKGDTTLNETKLAEVKDRDSM